MYVHLNVLFSRASTAAASSQKCPSAAPNAKNVKQMLLDWCRAKTEPYEVNISNSLPLRVSACLSFTYLCPL